MRQELRVSITLTLKHHLCALLWFSKQDAALPSGQAGSRLTQLPVAAPQALTVGHSAHNPTHCQLPDLCGCSFKLSNLAWNFRC